MSIRINDTAPNFTAASTHGEISFHEWIGNDWCVFASHPKDFTPICTTELGLMAKMENDFAERGVKLLGLSADSVEDHFKWIKDIEDTQGVKPSFPIIGDTNLSVAKLYEMLPETAIAGNRTAVENATIRAIFVIDKNKKVRAMTFYPMSAGRSFKEILRLVDALKLYDERKVVTPVNWERGCPVLIAPNVSNEEAEELFPQGWTTEKPGGGEATNQRPYLRYVQI